MIATGTDTLLRVRQLQVDLPTPSGMVRIVDGIDLDVEVGRTTGVAGESGSGKTIAMLALLGLLPAGASIDGTAMFRGQNLLALSDKRLARCRGNDIALVMQDPTSALHPMLSIGVQLSDHVRHHLGASRGDARTHAIDLLRQVHIPDPSGALDAYPHQFSGGMRQRIALAMALACDPVLLIADEPTTGLDVTVQAGILRLLDELRTSRQLAMILITHDLGVMSALADTLTIMYAGRVVEEGATSTVLTTPRHPYTAALLRALPHPDRSDRPLVPIPGYLAPPGRRPSGCSFHPRCAYAQKACAAQVPSLAGNQTGHRHACIVDPFGSDDEP